MFKIKIIYEEVKVFKRNIIKKTRNSMIIKQIEVKNLNRVVS
jgi:hypothetical protein